MYRALRLALVPLAAALAAALPACAADDDSVDPAATEDDLTTRCTATYRTLQKDAYKDVGGRTSALWPPHTTTDLRVVCGKTELGYTIQGNHGSKPGDKDPTGRELLDVIKVETRTGTKAEMTALLKAYQGCECNPSKFLGMATLGSGPAKDLVDALIPLLKRDVTCAGGVAPLTDALAKGDIDGVTKLLPTCKFTGNDLRAALDEAMAQVAKTSGSTLATYHVCNNDAALQAELFRGYSSKNSEGFCGASSKLCQGPLWYYTP